MDSFLPMKISSTGLNAQRIRMNIIASNLANVDTTQSADGSGPYRRRDVIFEAKQISFDEMLGSEIGDIGNVSSGSTDEETSALRNVEVKEIFEDKSDPILVYDPQHPDADSSGYVRYPNISVMEEMTNLISAQRSYEANLAVMKTTKDMIDKAVSLIAI